MVLFECKPADIDRAWRDGAHVLSEATKWAAREITADQLKMLLSRGERTLIGARDDSGVKGWAAVQVQQLPNIRVLFVYCMAGRGICSPQGFGLLTQYAVAHGCTSIRGAQRAAMIRLSQKFGAKVLYSVIEIEVA